MYKGEDTSLRTMGSDTKRSSLNPVPNKVKANFTERLWEQQCYTGVNVVPQ